MRFFQKNRAGRLQFAPKNARMEKTRRKGPSAGNGGVSMESDGFYMGLAIEQARIAAGLGEVPVGAVAVWDDGRIVGVGCNRRESGKNALYHAEIAAIDAACKTLHGWRLHKATLYVTLEPCPMCAGAIVNARIRRVVYGAPDPRAGAMESILRIGDLPLNHRFEQVGGVRRDECAGLLRDFFAALRQKQSGDSLGD